MELKPTFISPDNPSQLREPREGDSFINEPDVSFDTISDLTDYKIGQSPRTKTANVMGYYSAGDGGGGTFYWDSSEDKANHNGGTVINPSHNSTIGSDNWYSATGDSTDTSGSGCWVRPDEGFVNVKWFGAKDDTESTEAFKSSHTALSSNNKLKIPDNTFLITDVEFSKDIKVECEGTLKRSENVSSSNYIVLLSGNIEWNGGILDGNKDYWESEFVDNDTSGRHLTMNVISDSIIKNLVSKNSVSKSTGNAFGGVQTREGSPYFENVISEATRSFNVEGGGGRMYDEDVDGNITKFDGPYYFKCDAKNYEEKGFVNNGDTGYIVLDNCTGSPLNTTTSQAFILGETGDDSKLHTLVIKDTNFPFASIDPSVQPLKTVNVKKTIIDNCEFYVNTDGPVMRVQDSDTGTKFREQKVIVRDSTFVTSSTTQYTINLTGGVSWYSKNCYYETGHNRNIISGDNFYSDNDEFVSSDGSFHIDTISSLENITIKESKFISDNGQLLTDYSGDDVGIISIIDVKGNYTDIASGNNNKVKIKFNIGEPRLFKDYESPPSNGTGWKVGDKILAQDPNDLGYQGYICVTSGEGGVDAQFEKFGVVEDTADFSSDVGIEGASTSGSYSFSDARADYIKMGSLVYVHINLIDITEDSAGSGDLYITGLPFTPISFERNGSVIPNTLDFSDTTINLVPQFRNDNGNIQIDEIYNNGTPTTVSVSDIVSGATNIQLSGCYRTND